MRTIRIAATPAEIDRCFAVMSQLRPLLVADEFVGRVQAQQAEGYQLAFLEDEGEVVSVAGFRMQNMLSSGKTLYVDDLVTDTAARSQGHGEAMIAVADCAGERGWMRVVQLWTRARTGRMRMRFICGTG